MQKNKNEAEVSKEHMISSSGEKIRRKYAANILREHDQV